MKQELESILSFGAQAVSGEKTIFDQAALRHLDRLMEGNSGYKTTPANPAVLSQELREGTAKNGQSPLAVIVCCSDSRVPPEHIFHAGIGELFIIRTRSHGCLIHGILFYPEKTGNGKPFPVFQCQSCKKSTCPLWMS